MALARITLYLLQIVVFCTSDRSEVACPSEPQIMSKRLKVLIIITLSVGAILFAWVYIEWGNNLWVPIFLHLFMNFFWMMFSAGENALGGVYSNIFRVVTIGLIIILTIIYKKKKGQKLEINKSTIWLKSTDYN